MISIFYIGYRNEIFDSTPILRMQFLQAETQMLMLLPSLPLPPKILVKLKFWASIQNLSIWKVYLAMRLQERLRKDDEASQWETAKNK